MRAETLDTRMRRNSEPAMWRLSSENSSQARSWSKSEQLAELSMKRRNRGRDDCASGLRLCLRTRALGASTTLRYGLRRVMIQPP